jgi:hypothetical protein
MTKTSNAALQDLNRKKALGFENKLKELAELMELIRTAIGGPLEIHSGYRCPELNGVTPGSSDRSQHMKGEACDYSLPGQATEAGMEALFQKTLQTLLDQGLMFGQLIKESAQRSYGVARWLHVSLGVPYRELYRCGQIVEMRNGAYTLLKTIALGR